MQIIQGGYLLNKEIKITKSKEYQYLTEGLKLRVSQLEDRINERMIETGMFYEELDGKLAELKQDKRNVETLHEKLIKKWRVCLSNEM